ncbi:predicted protein [Arabidopsis lyrata subsp. lyrata]|uniref:Predicted protein n=1 Tax=Arabidopsis lyrata subsp. lyrata TaxID=81972 RepID=D7KAM0_ARALL|nr:predicted protein [Arabidopsis lyrata subsp. lyrata]
MSFPHGHRISSSSPPTRLQCLHLSLISSSLADFDLKIAKKIDFGQRRERKSILMPKNTMRGRCTEIDNFSSKKAQPDNLFFHLYNLQVEIRGFPSIGSTYNPCSKTRPRRPITRRLVARRQGTDRIRVKSDQKSEILKKLDFLFF